MAVLALLLCITIFSTGCIKTVTAPVPGQINTYDAYAYRVLFDTQAAINAFKADVSSGKVAETATIKSALNQAIADYNIAEAAYQVWHAAGGGGSTTSLTAAIAKVQGDITNIVAASTTSASTGGSN
jgi:hypothetical protein